MSWNCETEREKARVDDTHRNEFTKQTEQKHSTLSHTNTHNYRPTTVLYKRISLDFIFHFLFFYFVFFISLSLVVVCLLLLSSIPFWLRPKKKILQKNKIRSWIFLSWKYFFQKHSKWNWIFSTRIKKKQSSNNRNLKKAKNTNVHLVEKEKKHLLNADLSVWYRRIFVDFVCDYVHWSSLVLRSKIVMNDSGMNKITGTRFYAHPTK